MRHFVEGAPKAAAMASSVPVINAGDGGHQHPTQTLADLMTIHRLKGHFDNLTIGMCGDLKYGRTVHSLLKAMSRYENVKFVFIAPDELKMPQDLIDELGDSISFVETKSMEEAMPQLDVLYMTRVQQERFDDVEQYERLKDSYILDKAKMALGKEDMMVLHPLPRVNEIEFDVDEDPRALYFDQAIYGMYVRMALIVALLGLTPGELTWEKTRRLPLAVHPEAKEVACTNPKCVTNNDRAVKGLARPTEEGHWACEYCDTVIK